MRPMLILLGIVVLSFLLISCTPSSPVAEESRVVSEASKVSEILENEPSVNTAPASPSTRTIRRVSPPALDPEIALLLNKNKDVTNYYYVYDASRASGYEVAVRGDKVKKTYSAPLKLRGDIYYDTIYLDRKQQTARGSCERPGILCRPHLKQFFVVEYTPLPPTPIDLVQPVTSAKKVGTEMFDDRQLQVIEFFNSAGKRERLSIDNYYGLPFRQVIYSSADMDADIEEEHTFTDISVGQVKASAVTLPADYVLIS